MLNEIYATFIEVDFLTQRIDRQKKPFSPQNPIYLNLRLNLSEMKYLRTGNR